MKSDWSNLTAARKGDQNALVCIYKKYSGSLLTMATLITGSRDSAKDAVQETFVRLLRSKIRHKDGNFKSFITTITYRLALKEKLRLKRFNDLDNYEFGETSRSFIQDQIHEENKKQIYNAVTSLPENQKNILVLRFYGGLSYETISEIEDLPIGTVKSRIFYAVKACREILKEKGVLE